MRITLSESEVESMVSDWVEKNMSGWAYQDSAIQDGSIEVAVDFSPDKPGMSEFLSKKEDMGLNMKDVEEAYRTGRGPEAA